MNIIEGRAKLNMNKGDKIDKIYLKLQRQLKYLAIIEFC